MKSNPLDIKIGKIYPAATILQKIEEKKNLDIQFGHIEVINEEEIKHEYFIDKDFIEKLNDSQIKVYTIIPRPSCENFAIRLLRNKDVKEVLADIEKDNTSICIIDESDLVKADYKNKSIKKSITSINKVLKANKMTFRASKHEDVIKIRYIKRKEKTEVDELK